MALSDTVRHEVETRLRVFCEKRVSPEVRDKVRLTYGFRGDSVTLYEDRVGWRDPTQWTHMPIAQFRFQRETGKWVLYCADRNSKWHIYDIAKPSSNLEQLLKAVDEDATGIFFG